MTGSYTVTGFDPIIARLRAMEQASVKAKEVVRVCGGLLLTEMQKQAHFHRYPYKDPDTPPPTGALKRSISLSFENGGMDAVVGPHMYYAAYVEYGTRFMRAEPYVRPAISIVGPMFIHYMEMIR